MDIISQYSETELLAFFLVLMRISAFVVAWPVFGISNVPAPLKILFALTMTVVVFPLVGWQQVSSELVGNQIIWLVIRELFIGLSFGFLARMFFFAISISGEIISTSLGLSSSQLFNPAMGSQTSSIEQFEMALATLFFLLFHGHLVFISGLIDSFQFLPLSTDAINMVGLSKFGDIVGEIMSIGFKLCAPIVVAIFFMNIAMAIVGRTVPQINVLITSLPINILVGFVIMIITLPMVMWQFHDVLEISVDKVFKVMRTY